MFREVWKAVETEVGKARVAEAKIKREKRENYKDKTGSSKIPQVESYFSK